MNIWIERIKNHAIWQEIDNAEEVINHAFDRELLNAECVLALDRLRSLMGYFKRKLNSTDPSLLSPPYLDSLIQSVNGVANQVGTFILNGEIGNLNAANDNADVVIRSMGSIPCADTTDQLTGIGESAGRYYKTLAGYLEEAMATQQKLSQLSMSNQEAVTQVRDALVNYKNQMDEILRDQQSQFSRAQDERASNFASNQADYLGKFSQNINEQQSQFSSDQDLRRGEFSLFQRENEAKIGKLVNDYDLKLKEHCNEFNVNENNLVKKHQETLGQLENSFVAEGKLKLDEVELQKVAIEKLVGVIGNQGVTYGYQKQANTARWALLVWQGLTVISLVGLIVVAFLMVFPGVGPSSHDSNPSAITASVASADDAKRPSALATKETKSVVGDSDFYHGLATRIFLSLTFGLLATYAARQASHFMAIEQKNRKMALELQALGPFIAPLPEEDQHKFRIQIGERSFATSENMHPKSGEEDPVTLPGLLKSKELREFISDRVDDAVKLVKPSR